MQPSIVGILPSQHEALMLNLFRTPSNRLLFLLLITDMVFVVMHIVLLRLGCDPFLFSLQADLGLSEIFQYAKEFWIVILLVMVAIGQRKWVYGSWACLFLYLLLDDSLQIHENLGVCLAEHFTLEPLLGLRARDFGEIAVSAFFGGILFSLIIAAYFFSDARARLVSRHLFFLVLCMVFFGIFVDMLHVALPDVPGLAVLEDGGEMVVMSLIVWYMFNLEWARSPSEVGGEENDQVS